MQRLGTKVCDIPTYEFLPILESFLAEFEERVSEPHRLLALDFALKDTPTRWCVAHKQTISEWP